MDEELHNHTTRSQTTKRKRSLSTDPDEATSVTKKRLSSSADTDMNKTMINNQTTEDVTAAFSEVSNNNNGIPDNVTELFEEIGENASVTQYRPDSEQGIDIRALDTSTDSILTTNTKTAETQATEPMVSSPVKQELTETPAPGATEAAEILSQTPTEPTSITTSSETRISDEENRPTDPPTTPTSIPLEKDTTAKSLDDVPVSISTSALETKTTTTPKTTNKKHHPGLTVPDKSSAVRQPFSDKFFFTNEAYEAYSYDGFMATIDSITKKNKPGLALSLERPASSSSSSPSASVSRPPSMQSAQPYQHHYQQQQQRSSYSHGATSMTTTRSSSSATLDAGKSNNPPTTTNAANSNILDSLLDSISKNDRPVIKPAHVPSDLEIAMQAADLPPTHQE